MENPNLGQTPRVVSPFSHAMRWGMLLGLCFIVNFLMSVSGIAVLSFFTWVLDIFILYLVYRIAKNYRDKECEGQIRYGQVFSYILLLFFFAALIAGVVKYIYLQFIAPDYLNTLYNQTMLLLESLGTNLPENFDVQLQQLLQPIQYTFQSITSDCFLGCFVGVIYGFFIRRN